MLVLSILQVLGVQGGFKEDPLTMLHQTLIKQTAPLLLLLDNFETPWDESDDQSEVESVLQRITAVSHVTLMITMRGVICPSGVKWTQHTLGSLGPLSLDAARMTFTG